MKKRLVLTARDVELFRWLWMLRVLTLGQLRRLGYYQPDTGQLSVLDNVRKRLKRLWDAGYFEGTRLLDFFLHFFAHDAFVGKENRLCVP